MNLVFLLEERSAQEMLQGLLPRILPETVHVVYRRFNGKHDLDRNLEGLLRGWLVPDTAFVVLRDQDAADCRKIKQSLVERCRRAGRPETVVRIACRELEGWYFGDLAAVERGLGVPNLARHGNRKQFRVPDNIHSPARELARLTGNAYRKIAGSRAIGRELSPESNRSRSFRVFLAGVRRAVQGSGPATS